MTSSPRREDGGARISRCRRRPHFMKPGSRLLHAAPDRVMGRLPTTRFADLRTSSTSSRADPVRSVYKRSRHRSLTGAGRRRAVAARSRSRCTTCALKHPCVAVPIAQMCSTLVATGRRRDESPRSVSTATSRPRSRVGPAPVARGVRAGDGFAVLGTGRNRFLLDDRIEWVT